MTTDRRRGNPGRDESRGRPRKQAAGATPPRPGRAPVPPKPQGPAAGAAPAPPAADDGTDEVSVPSRPSGAPPTDRQPSRAVPPRRTMVHKAAQSAPEAGPEQPDGTVREDGSRPAERAASAAQTQRIPAVGRTRAPERTTAAAAVRADPKAEPELEAEPKRETKPEPKPKPEPRAEARPEPKGERPPVQQPMPQPVPAVRTRRARLKAARIDPWSVMKVSFLLSIALGIVTVVAATVLWLVLDSLGVFTSVGDTVREATQGSQTQADAGWDLKHYLSLRNTLLVSSAIAVIDVILVTALATLSSFLYNLSAVFTGGVEVTLAEED